jgi:hypothetical protein
MTARGDPEVLFVNPAMDEPLSAEVQPRPLKARLLSGLRRRAID